MTGDTTDRLLWIAFGLLFAVVLAAAVVPVRPLVWAVPLWAVVVLGASVATVAVAVVALRVDWPREVSGT